MGKFPTDQKDTKGKDDSHSSGSGGSFMDASPPIKKDKDKKGEKLSKVEDGDNQDKEQHDGYQDKCGSQKTKEDPSDNNNASRMGKKEQIEESGQAEEESCTPLPKKTLDTSPMDISPTTIETSDLEKESKGKRKAASSDDDMPPEKKTKGGLAINN